MMLLLRGSGLRFFCRWDLKRREVRQIRSSCTVKRRVRLDVLKRTILEPVLEGNRC
jgi:hypothetical protein